MIGWKNHPEKHCDRFFFYVPECLIVRSEKAYIFKIFKDFPLLYIVSNVMQVCSTKGVFTWRRASPLGRASPTKRAGFHLAFTWEKQALLPGLARLAESPLANYIYFPKNPGIRYLRTSFHFISYT